MVTEVDRTACTILSRKCSEEMLAKQGARRIQCLELPTLGTAGLLAAARGLAERHKPHIPSEKKPSLRNGGDIKQRLATMKRTALGAFSAYCCSC